MLQSNSALLTDAYSSLLRAQCGRLANYRKEHPSPIFKPDPTMVGAPLSEVHETLAEGHRLGLERLDFMVKRYATKP